MPKAPLELTLYAKDDEPLKTLKRLIVPWGILKKAVRLTKRLGKVAEEEITEDDIDEMAGLVIEVFGEQNVTREEIDLYADLGDILTLIREIGYRGHALVPNAPPVGK